MWSDESRFTLFQSDGRIRVRREENDVMCPKIRSADYLNILNDQVFPTMDFPSLMAWACIFQDDNARNERAQIVKSMRQNFHKWIGQHRVQTLTPLIIFEMYWRNGEELLQLWMEINVVTFHNHIKTMPWRMCAVIKAKWGPMKY